MSTSNIDWPSRKPVISGFIEGYEGGAVAGGRVDGSKPSFNLDCSGATEVDSMGTEGVLGVSPVGSTGAFEGGAFRSRGVYSVVNWDCA